VLPESSISVDTVAVLVKKSVILNWLMRVPGWGQSRALLLSLMWQGESLQDCLCSPAFPFNKDFFFYFCPKESLKKKKKKTKKTTLNCGICDLQFFPLFLLVFGDSCVLCDTLCFVFFCCCLFAVVNCTDPGHLENSIRQVQPSGPHRFSFGTTVSYQCSHGYYLLGTHVLTCQGDGTWDRALPQCLCKFFRIIPIHHRFHPM